MDGNALVFKELRPVDGAAAARVVAQAVGRGVEDGKALNAVVEVVETVSLLPVAQPQLAVEHVAHGDFA